MTLYVLGFVGNAHYCPSCMNHFHDSCGQHEPDCTQLAEMMKDDEWWDEVGRRIEHDAARRERFAT